MIGYQFALGAMVGGGGGIIGTLALVLGLGLWRDARADRTETDRDLARIQDGLRAIATTPTELPAPLAVLAAHGQLPQRGVPPPIRVHAYVDDTVARDPAYPQADPLPRRVPGLALGELPEDAPTRADHLDAALAHAYGLPDTSRRGQQIAAAAGWITTHVTFLAGLCVAAGWALHRPTVARHASDEEAPAHPTRGCHRPEQVQPLSGAAYAAFNAAARVASSLDVPRFDHAVRALLDAELTGAAR